MTGAVTGFSVGFLWTLLIAPLGGGSLVLLTTGYLAGLFRERFEIHSPLVPPLLCMGLTLFAELGFGAVALMLGTDTTVSPLVLRDHTDQGASSPSSSSAWPIYTDLRRALRPALVEEPALRRPRLPAVLGPRNARACADDLSPGNRMALRIAVVGSVAVALFAVLFLRLPGFTGRAMRAESLAEAQNNRTREVPGGGAARRIRDRAGNVLSRRPQQPSAAAQRRPKLPADPAEERAELTPARRTSPT